jgi:hypothetical protein
LSKESSRLCAAGMVQNRNHISPAAKQMKGNPRMPQADAHHASSRHNALTTARTSTTARRRPRAAASSQLSPASSQHTSTPAQANFADPTRERACEKRNGPKPTPRVHASIAKPLTQPAPADRRHRANGGAPWFSLSSTQCTQISHGGRFYTALRKVKFASNNPLAHTHKVGGACMQCRERQ